MALDDQQRARYARQILLPELGVEGQQRIALGSAAVVGDGSLAHRVAERYARRAGFAQLKEGTVDLDADAPASVVSRAAPRALLAGARAALRAMRAAALLE